MAKRAKRAAENGAESAVGRPRSLFKDFRVVQAGEIERNPKNWRAHPPFQREVLRDALREIGFAGALLCYEPEPGRLRLIDGEARLDELPPDFKVPVVVIDADEKTADALLATWDPLSALAGRNDQKVRDLLEGVAASGEALRRFLDELRPPTMSPVEDVEPRIDEAEELRAKWGVERGQVWQLGEHRLMCGDSTNGEDVGLLLGGAVPLLCVTDPPYGVSYDPGWRNVEAAKGHLAYAASRVGPVTADDRADWGAAWRLFSGDVIYSWHPSGATSLVHAAALQDSGFVLRMQIIWAKSNFPIGRGDYHVRHEPCWYAVREGRSSRRTNDRTQTTLWEVNLDRNVAGGTRRRSLLNVWSGLSATIRYPRSMIPSSAPARRSSPPSARAAVPTLWTSSQSMSRSLSNDGPTPRARRRNSCHSPVPNSGRRGL